MDEVEVQRTPGSTAIEAQVVGEPLQDPSGVDKTATTVLLGDDGSADGASPENGGGEEEAARLVPQQGVEADDLEGEGAAGPIIMLGGVDGTALEAPATDPSDDSSTTLVDDTREALRASLLAHEEDGAVLGDAHEQASLSSLGPDAGHLEREVASAETSVTDDDRTATNVVMPSPKRSNVSEDEGFFSNEQQSGVSELSATATDIQEGENARSRATSDSVAGSSEAAVENDAVRVSEGSSGSHSGTTLTSTAEGEVFAAPVGLASGRGSTIVTASGSEGEDASGIGTFHGGTELPQSMAAGGELLAEGASDAVDTLRTSSTQQESAAEIATPQPSTGDALQDTLGSNNSMAVAPLEEDCILDGPAQQASHILIETVVAKYMYLAVAKAMAAAVAAPEVEAPAPDEVPGNPILEPHASSSALEEEKETVASSSAEKGVESPESGSFPVSASGVTPNDTESDETRGDDSSAIAVCAAAAPQVSVEHVVVRDYLKKMFPATTRAEVAAMAMAALGDDRSLSPESVAVICSDEEAANAVPAGNVSGEDGETGGSGLVAAEGLGGKALRPALAEDRDEHGIEEGQSGRLGHDRSKLGSQISVAAQRLVDDITATSLVTVAAVVTARARDKTYACAPPVPANRIGDTSAPLCEPSLEDKCPTEGAQTPRTARSDSTSPASVSSQDLEDGIEGDISPSTAYAAEPLLPRDLDDVDNSMVHEAPQAGTSLAPKSGESTPESTSGPRVGATDNGLMEPPPQQGDLPAADGSAQAMDLQSSLSASDTIDDDDDCVTNTDDVGQIDGERFVPAPDSPISTEKRAVADYIQDIMQEAVSAVGRTQGVGETFNDAGGSSPSAAQVHSPRKTQDPAAPTASEEESLRVPATPAEVVDGDKYSTDATVASVAGSLDDQQSMTDSASPSLLSSDFVRDPTAADSLVSACGTVGAEGGAVALDPATLSVPSAPSANGDENVGGVSGADSIQDQTEVSPVPSMTEPAECTVATAPGHDGDRATGSSMPVTTESAADVHPVPMGQEVSPDPPLPSPSIEDPCCSSALLPDGSEGSRRGYSPEPSTTVTVHSASEEEAPAGRRAIGSPSSCVSLRCRVVADYLSDKLHETVAAETASQVSAEAGEPSLQDGQDGQPHSNGGAEGKKSGVDQTLVDEESGDAAPSPPSRAAQGTPPEEEKLGIVTDSDAEVVPDASESAAPGQPTLSPTGTLPSAPPTNDAEDGPHPSPSEEHAPTPHSSLTPSSSVQNPDSSSNNRQDDLTDNGESRSSLNSLATAGVESTPTEARVSGGDAKEKTTTPPPSPLRYKVMTGCNPDEVSEVVEADAVASSRPSRACGLEPAMGVRGEAIRVDSDANDARPSSASLRCGVVTGCLSDEVRGVVAADAIVASSRSPRACGLDSEIGLQSEVRVGSEPKDSKPPSASPRYRVVTGCLSDEVRGVAAADAIISCRPSSAVCGLDSATGVQSEAQINSNGSDNASSQATTGVPGEQAALCPPLLCSPHALGTAVSSNNCDAVELKDASLAAPSPEAEPISEDGPDSNVDDTSKGHSAEERDNNRIEQKQAGESGDVVHSLAPPMPQATPQQDLSDSIDPEVDLEPESSAKTAKDSLPHSPTETLDHDSSSSRHHPDEPNSVDIRQRENLEADAALSTKMGERINQGANSSSPPSPASLLRRAVVTHYLADKFRDTVVANTAISASTSMTGGLNPGLMGDARKDQTIQSAVPPGCVPGTVPAVAAAATKTAANDTESSAASEDDGDVSLAADPPLAKPAEVGQGPAGQIEPCLPDAKQENCCEARAESGVDGGGDKEGSADAEQQVETPTPTIGLEETKLPSAEPSNAPGSDHTPVNVEPLASAAEVLSCPRGADVQIEALETGAAEARADAVAWLAGVGGKAKSAQAKASEDRAGAVAWLARVGGKAKSTQAKASQDRAEAVVWLAEFGGRAKSVQAKANEGRDGAVVWLAEVGGRAKSTQAKASEDRAGAVAWLHNVGGKETRVQGARFDASAWLRETGERAVSLQDRAEAARLDAVEWLKTKGATELQRPEPTKRPPTASQQQLDGDGVDQGTCTAEAEPSDMDTANPSSHRSQKSTSGDRERGSTTLPEQQTSEPSAIDVARKAGQAICLEDTVRSETDNEVAPPCQAELQRIEDELVATTHPLPCQSAKTSVIRDTDIEPPAGGSSLDDRSVQPLRLEVGATSRLPHEDPAAPTTEPGPQEPSQMLAVVGENDWARVSLSRTPPFDALNSPSIALRWEPAGGQKTRLLPPGVEGFDSTASPATIADKALPVEGSAMASTAAAAGGAVDGCPAAAAVPSNNGGSEWVEFFAPPHRMAPTGDAYGAESVCSAEASASTTARRISTGSTLPSYGSGETGGGVRIPRRDDDPSRTINEGGGHPEGGGAVCGGQGAEMWTPPPKDPRGKRDCKRWSKAAERSRRYTRRWESFLSRVHRYFDSEVQVRKRISVVRRAHPDVNNEVAFVALAQSYGRASEAAAVLHLSRAKEEATLVTMMLDVAYFISLAREAAEARRRSRQLEERQSRTTVGDPQSKGTQQAHHQGGEEKQQQQQQGSHLAHHTQQRERRRDRAVQQRQRDGSSLSSEVVDCGGFNGGNDNSSANANAIANNANTSTNAGANAHGRGVWVEPETSGETVDRERRGRLRGRPVPTGIIDQSRRRMWSRGSESCPTLLPPIVSLADGTPPTPNTLKTVLATSTSVALGIPEGFGLTAEFGGSIRRASDQGHAIKSTKRSQRAVLRARARFQRQRMAEIMAPAAHQHGGSGLDAVTERFLVETHTLDRDSRDLDNRLRAQKRQRDPGLGWGKGKVYGSRSVDGSGLVWGQSSSAFLASIDTPLVGATHFEEAAGGALSRSPSAASAATAVAGCGDRGSCRVQNYFTQALADDGFCAGKERGGGRGGGGGGGRGGGGRALAGADRAPRNK